MKTKVEPLDRRVFWLLFFIGLIITYYWDFISWFIWAAMNSRP